MHNTAFILTLIGCILVANRLFRLTNILNPFVMFFWFHVVFFYIGILYSNIYNKYGFYIDTQTKYTILSGLIIFIFGGIISKLSLEAMGYKYINIKDIHIVTPNSSKQSAMKYSLIPLYIFGALIAVYYSHSIGGYIWLSGNFEELRISSRKGIGFLVIISINLLTYSALVYLSGKKITPLYILLVILTSILLLAYGNRAPFLLFLIVLLLVIHIKSRSQFSIKKLAMIGISVFILMVIFGAIRKSPDELMQVIIHRLPWRPFVNILNFQVVLDNFPSPINFLYGKGYLIDLITLLPGHQPNLGTWVKDALGMTYEGGSLTTSYLGVGYINFGKPGLLLYPLIYGFILNMIYMLLVNNQYISTIKLILIILISFSLGGSVNTGLLPVILYTTAPIVIIYITHRILIGAIRVFSTRTWAP